MADGIFPSLISKDRDANATDNPIYAQLSDGTTTIGVTSGALDVNIASGSLSIDFSYVDDSAFTVGTDNVGATGYLADETTPDSVDEGDIGIPRMTLSRKPYAVISDPSSENHLAIDGSGLAQIDLADHAITNTNALPISKDNSANSETNPIFVQTVTTAVSGAEIHDFDQAAAVAADSTSNHDYTVANTTFLLKSVIVSASGNGKFEVQVGPLAGLVTKAVGFLTGREGDTKQIDFCPAIEIPSTSTGTIRIIRTNRENQAQDLYSTIIGTDV